MQRERSVSVRKASDYMSPVLGTYRARLGLRWCAWIVAALLINSLIACYSDSPQPSNAQTVSPPAAAKADETLVPTRVQPPKAIPTLPGASVVAVKDGSEVIDWPPPDGSMLELLDMVPEGFSQHTVEFSFSDPDSIGGYKVFAGGRIMHSRIGERVVQLNELMGLDFTRYEKGIWSWKPGKNSETFAVFQGEIAGSQAREKLVALGYRMTNNGGADYFELAEDYDFDFSHPLRAHGLDLNRLALSMDSIIAAPATSIIEDLITARQKGSTTLAGSAPHSLLVRAVGDGMVSGAFFKPRWISEAWKSTNPKPPDRLDRYQEADPNWGTLPDYDLALLGYRISDEEDEIVMALYFPSSTDAASASVELKVRWDSYFFDPFGQMSVADYMPVNQMCSALSLEVTQTSDGSIVVGSCTLKKTDNKYPRTGGPSLWLWLFNTGQMEFFARSLDEPR